MRLAILMTNTDESTFAQRHPKDGEKFTALIHQSRPTWQCKVFSVKDGIFPDTLDFDGYIITGSPASVHDDASWIAKLVTIIREIVAQQTPLFGACFGHQVIAHALGSNVSSNPQGWVLGQVETQLIDRDTPERFYAAHKEQVTDLPDGARIMARTTGCDIAGFAIENHVLTTQYHPEMTADFIAALLEAFADDIGRDVTHAASKSLGQPTNYLALSEWMTSFFEAGVVQAVE